VSYRESATAVPGAVLWRSRIGPAPSPALILPDGCLDLLWDGRHLFVAGPDTTARRFQRQPAEQYVALRFSGGLGPALLGVPADALTDRTVDLDELWASAPARRLTEQVAADPIGALTAWLVAVSRRAPADPLGARVAAMASAGVPVAAMADRTGLSARQLQRRCLPLFGYGPRHLARVLRLLRAVDAGRAGLPLAEVAAGAGYCDQAHLSREVRALAGDTPRAVISHFAAP
jgi:AraC-like DNA-binding protein